LRTSAAKRFQKVEHATTIIWRLLRVTEQRFRKLNVPEQCKDVFHGTRYEDGDGVVIPAHPSAQKAAACRTRHAPGTHPARTPAGRYRFTSLVQVEDTAHVAQHPGHDLP